MPGTVTDLFCNQNTPVSDWIDIFTVISSPVGVDGVVMLPVLAATAGIFSVVLKSKIFTAVFVPHILSAAINASTACSVAISLSFGPSLNASLLLFKYVSIPSTKDTPFFMKRISLLGSIPQAAKAKITTASEFAFPYVFFVFAAKLCASCEIPACTAFSTSGFERCVARP